MMDEIVRACPNGIDEASTTNPPADRPLAACICKPRHRLRPAASGLPTGR